MTPRCELMQTLRAAQRAIDDVTRQSRRRPVTLKRLTPCLVVHGIANAMRRHVHLAIPLIAVPARASGKRAVPEGWVMVEIYGT